MKGDGRTVWVLWGWRRGKWHLDGVRQSRTRAEDDARAMRGLYPRETFVVRGVVAWTPKEPT